jgi:hypothetical protein
VILDALALIIYFLTFSTLFITALALNDGAMGDLFLLQTSKVIALTVDGEIESACMQLLIAMNSRDCVANDNVDLSFQPPYT